MQEKPNALGIQTNIISTPMVTLGPLHHRGVAKPTKKATEASTAVVTGSYFINHDVPCWMSPREQPIAADAKALPATTVAVIHTDSKT